MTILLRWGLLVLVGAGLMFASDRYSGSWQSDRSGGGGKFEMTVGESAGETNVTFTIGAAEVKTVVKRLKMVGSDLEIAYEFEIQGNKLTSTVSGTRDGGKLTAKYRTVVSASGDQVDSGVVKTGD